MKMSSTKTSKSSKSSSKEDKDIVVSFASDSDDDERSSTASSNNSDSDWIKPAAVSSPVASAAVTSVKQKATKQVEPDLNKEAADQQPSRKQVTPPSDEDKPSTRTSKSKTSSSTSSADKQSSRKQVTPSSDEEKPASKTTKSKSKESSKSTPLVNENGSAAAPTDETNKSDEPKSVKKKKTVKADLTAVNGDSKQEDASDELKRKPTENSEATEVGDKKKSTKTTKKALKAAEKIENVDVDSTAADKKSKLLDETTSVVTSSATTAETDDSTAKPIKKTKKSTKISSAAVNGESDKTAPAEVPEKSSEKKMLKKSKESAEDSNSTALDTLAKVDQQDPVKQKTNEETIANSVPKQSDDVVSSGLADSKIKQKKKKEKSGDAKAENDQPIEPETAAVAIEEGATSGKVVKKKKVKKTASADIPTDTADSITPSIIIETTDAIEKLDLDADREVQLICNNQLEAAAINAEYVESTYQEVPATATESKPTEFTSPAFAVFSGSKEIDLQQNKSSSDSVKLTVSPGSQADNTDSCITLLKERTHDHDFPSDSPSIDETPTTASKDENKEYLTASENKISSADVNKVDGKSLENEDSDYTYRRKSMDDFIKRILAEAREEQQKKMNAVQSSNEDSSSSAVTAAEINTESDQSPKKSIDGQEVSPLVGTDTGDTLPDKGLMSVDRKRVQTGYPSLGLEDKKSTLSGDLDLDDDLAQIKGYFSRRGQTSLSKLDPMNDVTYSTERSRLALDDGDDISITHKILKDVLPDDSGAFLSRFRQTERNDAINDDDYAPKRREETTEVVRSSTKPVRSVIDQQTEVVQQLKTTSRSIDELENEIRALRETFLDRQARIDSLRSAIDAESRMYEAEQTAANDRIQQQKIPGGRFVRDEFLASFTTRLIPGSETSLRSRSGSISSITGPAIGSLSVGSGISEPFSVPRATSLKPISVNADTQRLQLGEADDGLSTTSGYSPGRFRRGGSVARERTYTMEEMLGGTGGYGLSSSTSRTSGLPSTDGLAPSNFSSSTWSSYSTSASPDVTRQYQPGLSYSSSYTRRFQNDSTDYRSPSSYSSISAYGDGGRTSSQYLSGLRLDRPYVRDSTSPSPSVSNSYSLTSSGSIDPSRFRRAQSVIDVSSNHDGSTSFVSTPGSTSGGGEFRSRFLDKVRGQKSSDDARAGSAQFKSRFLRSNYDPSSKKY